MDFISYPYIVISIIIIIIKFSIFFIKCHFPENEIYKDMKLTPKQ